MSCSSAPSLPAGSTAHAFQICFLAGVIMLWLSPPFSSHPCCPWVLVITLMHVTGLNTRETLHIRSILYRASRTPRLSWPLENKWKKKVVYELCKSAKKNSDWNQQFWNVYLLETVQGGWKLTHLYLASFISDSVTFLAVGPFLFYGQKALRYSWGWELTYHLDNTLSKLCLICVKRGWILDHQCHEPIALLQLRICITTALSQSW